jgi:hypothetical protein
MKNVTNDLYLEKAIYMDQIKLHNFANMKHKLSPYTYKVYGELAASLSEKKILVPSYFVEDHTYIYKQAIKYKISNEIVLKSRKI